MIPRIIHRIWLEDPMPETFANYGRRWSELHPGWRVIDWRDPSELPPLHNSDLYDRAQAIYPNDWKRFRSDLVRLELLASFGGLYVDTDVEPLSPIDELLEGRPVVAGRSPQHINGHHPITNAVVASVPGHRWVKALIEGAADAVETHGHLTLAQSIGPWHLTRVYESGHWPDVHILHELYEGPWLRHDWNNAARKRGEGV